MARMTTPDTLAECQIFCESLKEELAAAERKLDGWTSKWRHAVQALEAERSKVESLTLDNRLLAEELKRARKRYGW
jgi:hypothetical protein